MMKKQSAILFISLISLLVSFSSCKKSDAFDIRGAWRMVEYFGGSNFDGSMTFSGDLSSGTFTDQNKISGTYQVNGFEVSFSFDAVSPHSGRVHASFSGTFSDENYMSGTGQYIYYDQNDEEVTCYWVCTR